MSGRALYLDWNATTPPHPSVLGAMTEAAQHTWANPASVHAAGRRARAVVEGVRESLASLLAVHPRDVVFTSGGTEANNLALSSARGLALSRLEHPSVTRVAERCASQGVPVIWVPLPASGRVEPAEFARALAALPKGSLAVLMAANHETGALQPVAEVAEVAHQAGAALHVDAVQALGKVSPELFRAADSVALAAHKIRGPKGVGALAFRGQSPTPVLVGGSQERGLRPGTVDPVAIAGFGAALEWARQAPARYSGLAARRDAFERVLASVAVPASAEVPRLPHVSSLSFAGRSGDELVAALDLMGVCISSGSACSAGTTEPSPVISAMLGAERARSTIRVSFGEETPADDLEQAAEAIFALIERRPPMP